MPTANAAGRVGEVVFVQGTATAQQPGETPRFLQKGEALLEGDVLTTGAKGFMLIAFRDGTRMTLAPNTVLAVDRLRHDAGEESASLRLLKGAMRAVTGLIGARNPAGVRVDMMTATIGVRGTEFDARICGEDCAKEEGRAPSAPAEFPPDVVARAVVVSGSAVAFGARQEATPRPFKAGSTLASGDTVRTGKASYAVLAFRDQSRVTVVADSEFRLDDVRFSGASADAGNFLVRLIRGGIRALTGLLGRRDVRSVNFFTTTAVIGLRGTELDIVELPFCFAPDDCEPGIHVAVLEGGPVELRAGDRILVLEQGETGVYVQSRDFLEAVGRIELPEPRPSEIEVPQGFFQAADGVGEGPYVALYQGAVAFCAANGECRDVVAGEAFQLRPGADRPTQIRFPTGLSTVPAPWVEFDPRAYGVSLKSGALICEIR
ncbi:MAG: FecR family protein [Burkholderiales bacterium]